MNEIKLLETYGPDGPSLSDEARQAARSRLLAEITAAHGVRRSAGVYRSPGASRPGCCGCRPWCGWPWPGRR